MDQGNRRWMANSEDGKADKLLFCWIDSMGEAYRLKSRLFVFLPRNHLARDL
jgi:hypothetical protein